MEALSQEVRDGNRGVWGRGGEEARTEAKLKDLESIRSSLEKLAGPQRQSLWESELQFPFME